MINNKISRRSALKVAGAGALVAGSGITPAIAAPKRGGTLRLALSGGAASDGFNPALHTGQMQMYMNQFSNRLVKEKADTGKLYPELATSWQAKNKNKEWTFKLRKGVKFHDGSKLTAKDVVYTIKWHTAEKSKSSVKSYFGNLTDVKAVDNYTVKMTFSKSEPDVPAIMAMYNTSILKNGWKDWTKPMGSGPYKIVSFEPGVKVVLKRNQDYWNIDNSAWIDKIEIIYINDTNSALNAFLSGQVDLIFVDTKIAKKLEKISKVHLAKAAGKRHITLPMIATKDPYTDLNVRMALKHSIDREKVIQNAFDGYGDIANDNPISSAYADYVPVKGNSYDLDKAKYYLKKSGNSKLNITYSANNTAVGASVEEVGLIMSESLKKIGANMKVVREPGDGYWTNVWMKKAFSASFWAGRPTALMMLNAAYISSASWNESFWKSKKFDKLLDAAASVSSAADKKDKLGEAQQLLTTEGSVIIPGFQVWMEASMKNKIGGHTKTVNMPYNNHYLDELWIK